MFSLTKVFYQGLLEGLGLKMEYEVPRVRGVPQLAADGNLEFIPSLDHSVPLPAVSTLRSLNDCAWVSGMHESATPR